MAELETAWATRTQGWERKRLQVIRLVAQHKLNAEEIAEAVVWMLSDKASTACVRLSPVRRASWAAAA